MARTFGKRLCTINDDPDWLALSTDARELYSALISQPDITAAGILPLTERRWRKYLHGDIQRVSDALDELAAAAFLVVDDDTAEVWIRTFVKHDGRLENANLAKSVHRAIEQIRSETVYTACGKQYPDITPARRPFEGPLDADGKGPETAPQLLDPKPLTQNPDPEPPSPTAPGKSRVTVKAIAEEAGKMYADQEVTSGRAQTREGLGSWKAKKLLEEDAEHLGWIKERVIAYRAWSGEGIPMSVLAASALGDTHSLTHYPAEPPEPADEPGPKLSPDRIQALIKPTEET